MTYPQVGEQMKRRRFALKLSMRAAAKLGGVSPTAWSDLEAGKSPASLSTQLAVAKALNWPLDWHDQIGQGLEVTQPKDDALAELRALVADLAERVAASDARLVAMGVEVAQLRGRRRRGDGQ